MRAADESSLPRLLRASLWGLPVAARDVVASRCERAARVWLRWRWWCLVWGGGEGEIWYMLHHVCSEGMDA